MERRFIMAHITDEQIKKYYVHDMEQYEEINMLTHIAKCEYCAGRFAAGIPETEMIKLPRGITAEILEKAEKIPTWHDRRKEYYGYCTRVALGMCMALGLLVTVNFSNGSYLRNPAETGQIIEEVGQNVNAGFGIGDTKKSVMEEKSRYDKKQSEMKKKQEEDRKKFIEKNRENSGRESFRINRVFNSLRSFCGLKNNIS